MIAASRSVNFSTLARRSIRTRCHRRRSRLKRHPYRPCGAEAGLVPCAEVGISAVQMFEVAFSRRMCCSRGEGGRRMPHRCRDGTRADGVWDRRRRREFSSFIAWRCRRATGSSRPAAGIDSCVAFNPLARGADECDRRSGWHPR